VKAPSYPHMTVDLKSVEVDGENAAFKLVNGLEFISLNIKLEFADAQFDVTKHGLAPYDDRDYTVFYESQALSATPKRSIGRMMFGACKTCRSN